MPAQSSEEENVTAVRVRTVKNQLFASLRASGVMVPIVHRTIPEAALKESLEVTPEAIREMTLAHIDHLTSRSHLDLQMQQ